MVNTGFKKALALFVTIVFVVTSIFSPRNLSAQTVQSAAGPLPLIDVQKIIASSGVASLEERYTSPEGPRGRTVIAIQDAHGIFDAQENIRALIEELQNTYGFQLVGLEGGAGKSNHTLLRTFPDHDVNQKIAREYMRRAELSGGEAAAILNREPGIFYGLENPDLYYKNRSSFLKAQGFKDANLHAIDLAEKKLDKQREKIFSPELLAFHKAEQQYLKGQLPLAEFIALLGTYNLSEQYPGVLAIFQAIAKARQAGKKAEEAKQAEEAAAKVEGRVLFEEIKNLSAAIKTNLSAGDKEAVELDALYQHLRVLSSLAALEIPRADYEEYLRHQSEFVISGLELDLAPALQFYADAVKRDDALYQNLIRDMKKERQSASIIVAGGFHTQGLREKMKKDGISFAIYSPRIHEMPKENNYLNVMEGRVSYASSIASPAPTMGLDPNGKKFVDNYAKAAIREKSKTPAGVSELERSWRDGIIRTEKARDPLADPTPLINRLETIFRSFVSRVSQILAELKEKYLAETGAEAKRKVDAFVQSERKRLETTRGASLGAALPSPEEMLAIDLNRWISKDLLKKFTEMNGGREPVPIHRAGNAEDVEKNLTAALDPTKIPGSNLVFLVLHVSNEAPSRIDHVALVDRADVIRKNIKMILNGSVGLEQFDYSVVIKVSGGAEGKPELELKTVSIGKSSLSPLRGNGFMSDSLKNIVSLLEEKYPASAIQSNAIDFTTAYWFGKYFSGRIQSFDDFDETGTEMAAYVSPEAATGFFKRFINPADPPDLKYFTDAISKEAAAKKKRPQEIFNGRNFYVTGVVGASLGAQLTPAERGIVDRFKTELFDPYFESSKKFPFTEESLAKVVKGKNINWDVSVRERFVDADGRPSEVLYAMPLLAYPDPASDVRGNLSQVVDEFHALAFAGKFYAPPVEAFHLTLQIAGKPQLSPVSTEELAAAQNTFAEVAASVEPFDVWVEGLTIDEHSGRVMAQVFPLSRGDIENPLLEIKQKYDLRTPNAPFRSAINILTPFQPLTTTEKEALIRWVEANRSRVFGRMHIKDAKFIYTKDGFALNPLVPVVTYPLGKGPAGEAARGASLGAIKPADVETSKKLAEAVLAALRDEAQTIRVESVVVPGKESKWFYIAQLEGKGTDAERPFGVMTHLVLNDAGEAYVMQLGSEYFGKQQKGRNQLINPEQVSEILAPVLDVLEQKLITGKITGLEKANQEGRPLDQFLRDFRAKIAPASAVPSTQVKGASLGTEGTELPSDEDLLAINFEDLAKAPRPFLGMNVEEMARQAAERARGPQPSGKWKDAERDALLWQYHQDQLTDEDFTSLELGLKLLISEAEGGGFSTGVMYDMIRAKIMARTFLAALFGETSQTREPTLEIVRRGQDFLFALAPYQDFARRRGLSQRQREIMDILSQADQILPLAVAENDRPMAIYVQGELGHIKKEDLEKFHPRYSQQYLDLNALFEKFQLELPLKSVAEAKLSAAGKTIRGASLGARDKLLGELASLGPKLAFARIDEQGDFINSFEQIAAKPEYQDAMRQLQVLSLGAGGLLYVDGAMLDGGVGRLDSVGIYNEPDLETRRLFEKDIAELKQRENYGYHNTTYSGYLKKLISEHPESIDFVVTFAGLEKNGFPVGLIAGDETVRNKLQIQLLLQTYRELYAVMKPGGVILNFGLVPKDVFPENLRAQVEALGFQVQTFGKADTVAVLRKPEAVLGRSLGQTDLSDLTGDALLRALERKVIEGDERALTQLFRENQRRFGDETVMPPPERVLHVQDVLLTGPLFFNPGGIWPWNGNLRADIQGANRVNAIRWVSRLKRAMAEMYSKDLIPDEVSALPHRTAFVKFSPDSQWIQYRTPSGDEAENWEPGHWRNVRTGDEFRAPRAMDISEISWGGEWAVARVEGHVNRLFNVATQEIVYLPGIKDVGDFSSDGLRVRVQQEDNRWTALNLVRVRQNLAQNANDVMDGAFEPLTEAQSHQEFPSDQLLAERKEISPDGSRVAMKDVTGFWTIHAFRPKPEYQDFFDRMVPPPAAPPSIAPAREAGELQAVGRSLGAVQLSEDEIKVIADKILSREDGGKVLLQPMGPEAHLAARMKGEDPQYPKLDLGVEDKNVLVIPGYSVNGFLMSEYGRARSVVVADKDPVTIAWLKGIKKYWNFESIKGHKTVGQVFLDIHPEEDRELMRAKMNYVIHSVQEGLKRAPPTDQLGPYELNKNISFHALDIAGLKEILQDSERFDFVFIPWLIGQKQGIPLDSSDVTQSLVSIQQISKPDVRIMITPVERENMNLFSLEGEKDLESILKNAGYQFAPPEALSPDEKFLIAVPPTTGRSLGFREEGGDRRILDDLKRAWSKSPDDVSVLKRLITQQLRMRQEISAPPEGKLSDELVRDFGPQFLKQFWPQIMESEDSVNRLHAIQWRDKINKTRAGWYGDEIKEDSRSNIFGIDERVSPDGRHLAVREGDRWRVVNTETLENIGPRTFDEIGNWSPDGRHLAVREGNRWRLMMVKAETLENIGTRTFDNIWNWSPDGRHLAVQEGNRWRLVDAETLEDVGPRTFDEIGNWSPDGRHLAVREGNRWRVVDAETLENIGTLTFYEIKFSPNGKLLAVWEGNRWRLVNAQTFKNVVPRAFYGIKFSPDGRFLAVREGDRWRLMNAETLENIGTLTFDEIKFSPDGRHLAVREGRRWRLVMVNAQTLEDVGTRTFDGIKFSPDGKLLVDLGGGQYRVVNADTLEDVGTRIFDNMTGWLADGRVLVVREGGRWRLVNAETLENIGPRTFYQVMFSPDASRAFVMPDLHRVSVIYFLPRPEYRTREYLESGLMVFPPGMTAQDFLPPSAPESAPTTGRSLGFREEGGDRGILDDLKRAWNASPNDVSVLKRLMTQQLRMRQEISAPPEGKLSDELVRDFGPQFLKQFWPEIMESEDSVNRLHAIQWRDKINKTRAGWYGDEIKEDSRSNVSDVIERVSPDGRHLAVREGDRWRLVNAETLENIGGRTFDEIRFSPDGRHLAVQEGNRWRLVDAETLEDVGPRTFDRIQFSPDGSLLVVREGYRWSLLNAKTFKNVGPLTFNEIKFSPDGRLLAFRQGIWWMLINTQTFEVVSTRTFNEVKFSPDGSCVVVRQGNRWELLDAETLENIGTRTFDWIEFSPDGRHLAVRKGYRWRLVNAQTFKNVGTRTFEGIEFSPDGRHLAVREGGRWRLVDAETLENIGTLTFDEIKFSPAGKLLVDLGGSRYRVVNAETLEDVGTRIFDDMTGWLADGRVLVVREGGRWRLVNAETLENIGPRTFHQVKFSPDASRAFVMPDLHRVSAIYFLPRPEYRTREYLESGLMVFPPGMTAQDFLPPSAPESAPTTGRSLGAESQPEKGEEDLLAVNFNDLLGMPRPYLNSNLAGSSMSHPAQNQPPEIPQDITFLDKIERLSQEGRSWVYDPAAMTDQDWHHVEYGLQMLISPSMTTQVDLSMISIPKARIFVRSMFPDAEDQTKEMLVQARRKLAEMPGYQAYQKRMEEDLRRQWVYRQIVEAGKILKLAEQAQDKLAAAVVKEKVEAIRPEDIPQMSPACASRYLRLNDRLRAFGLELSHVTSARERAKGQGPAEGSVAGASLGAGAIETFKTAFDKDHLPQAIRQAIGDEYKPPRHISYELESWLAELKTQKQYFGSAYIEIFPGSDEVSLVFNLRGKEAERHEIPLADPRLNEIIRAEIALFFDRALPGKQLSLFPQMAMPEQVSVPVRAASMGAEGQAERIKQIVGRGETPSDFDVLLFLTLWENSPKSFLSFNFPTRFQAPQFQSRLNQFLAGNKIDEMAKDRLRQAMRRLNFELDFRNLDVNRCVESPEKEPSEFLIAAKAAGLSFEQMRRYLLSLVQGKIVSILQGLAFLSAMREINEVEYLQYWHVIDETLRDVQEEFYTIQEWFEATKADPALLKKLLSRLEALEPRYHQQLDLAEHYAEMETAAMDADLRLQLKLNVAAAVYLRKTFLQNLKNQIEFELKKTAGGKEQGAKASSLGLQQIREKFPSFSSLIDQLAAPGSLGEAAVVAGYKKGLSNFELALRKISRTRAAFDPAFAVLAREDIVGLDALRQMFRSDPHEFAEVVLAFNDSQNLELVQRVFASEIVSPESLRQLFVRQSKSFIHALQILDAAETQTAIRALAANPEQRVSLENLLVYSVDQFWAALQSTAPYLAALRPYLNSDGTIHLRQFLNDRKIKLYFRIVNGDEVNLAGLIVNGFDLTDKEIAPRLSLSPEVLAIRFEDTPFHHWLLGEPYFYIPFEPFRSAVAEKKKQESKLLVSAGKMYSGLAIASAVLDRASGRSLGQTQLLPELPEEGISAPAHGASLGVELKISMEEKELQYGLAKVVSLEVDPKIFGIHVAVKEDLQNHLYPVDRTAQMAKYVDEAGNQMTDGNEILATRTWLDENVTRVFEAAHPGVAVVAAVDNCSLFWNQGFVTYADGKLFYPVGEDFEHKTYSSLVIRKDGGLVMGGVRYQKMENGAIRVQLDGRDVTDDVRYATFGQFLLDAAANPRKDIENIISQFQDLRHVFRLPKIGDIYLGVGELSAGNYELAKKAWRAPVELTVNVPTTELTQALAKTGYTESKDGSVRARGEFAIRDGKLMIFLMENPYPRTLVGLTRDGKLVILGVSGKSGQQGSTLSESAQLAKEKNLVQAMLLDHGGSAKIFANGEFLLPSSEGRNFTTSALVIASPRAAAKSLGAGVSYLELAKKFALNDAVIVKKILKDNGAQEQVADLRILLELATRKKWWEFRSTYEAETKDIRNILNSIKKETDLLKIISLLAGNDLPIKVGTRLSRENSNRYYDLFQKLRSNYLDMNRRFSSPNYLSAISGTKLEAVMNVFYTEPRGNQEELDLIGKQFKLPTPQEILKAFERIKKIGVNIEGREPAQIAALISIMLGKAPTGYFNCAKVFVHIRNDNRPAEWVENSTQFIEAVDSKEDILEILNTADKIQNALNSFPSFKGLKIHPVLMRSLMQVVYLNRTRIMNAQDILLALIAVIVSTVYGSLGELGVDDDALQPNILSAKQELLVSIYDLGVAAYKSNGNQPLMVAPWNGREMAPKGVLKVLSKTRSDIHEITAAGFATIALDPGFLAQLEQRRKASGRSLGAMKVEIPSVGVPPAPPLDDDEVRYLAFTLGFGLFAGNQDDEKKKLARKITLQNIDAIGEQVYRHILKTLPEYFDATQPEIEQMIRSVQKSTDQELRAKIEIAVNRILSSMSDSVRASLKPKLIQSFISALREVSERVTLTQTGVMQADEAQKLYQSATETPDEQAKMKAAEKELFDRLRAATSALMKPGEKTVIVTHPLSLPKTSADIAGMFQSAFAAAPVDSLVGRPLLHIYVYVTDENGRAVRDCLADLVKTHSPIAAEVEVKRASEADLGRIFEGHEKRAKIENLIFLLPQASMAAREGRVIEHADAAVPANLAFVKDALAEAAVGLARALKLPEDNPERKSYLALLESEFGISWKQDPESRRIIISLDLKAFVEHLVLLARAQREAAKAA